MRQCGTAGRASTELLAIIFGSGVCGENVVDLSARPLRNFGVLGDC